ncbi:MAG: hypothetical protein QOI35_2828 [Cryptosporangiaceae bacterium]|jgi:secreted trypsin-like serine protease|nr:hypothetical protein [Cryptosporangiaceae bacterium]MDQ1656708.1 hypothetical protein [Cryptosporangiaceae bacterium]
MRLRSRWLLLSLLAAALALPVAAAHAGTIRPQIVGGQNAPSPYPFMVSIQVSSQTHWCGGVLVAPSWVVSAAHCDGWFPLPQLRFRVGSVDRTAGGTVASADRAVSHPTADLVAYHLTAPVTETPVPIAGAAPDGSALRLLGWGCTQPVTGGCAEQPRILQQLDTTLVTPSRCVSARHPGGIGAGQLCVDSPGGAGSCYGDSGGPALAHGTGGGWLLAGITSDGTTDVCAAGPSIYVSALAAKAWIQQVTSQ